MFFPEHQMGGISSDKIHGVRQRQGDAAVLFQDELVHQCFQTGILAGKGPVEGFAGDAYFFDQLVDGDLGVGKSTMQRN